MSYVVVSPYRKLDGTLGEVGSAFDGPPDQAERLVRAGCLRPAPAGAQGGNEEAVVETEAETGIEPEEAAAKATDTEGDVEVRDIDEFHTGAGWYSLPGRDEPVRGRDKALEIMNGTAS